jgi:membrane protease YdiL (CAAX protease family)
MATRFSRADWEALHGILLFALLVAGTFVPLFRIWPLLWVAPLAGYFTLVALTPALRETFTPWKFGRVTGTGIVATVVISILASTALVLFQQWTQPDLHGYAAALPKLPAGGIILAAIVFPPLNAFLEEIIFRGVFFPAIEAQTNTWAAVVATAALFGWGHMHGYPPGPLGAVLAGVYGLALGWLRAVTGGLGLPVMAHIVADATIIAIIAKAGVF